MHVYIYKYNYNALILLGTLCISLIPIYNTLDKCLKINNKYQNLSLQRRRYVIKNIIKSCVLLSMIILLIKPIIIPIILYDKWNNNYIHIGAAFYTVNDLMGLVMVKNLPYSTKAHHTITTTLCLVSFGIDFQTSELGKLLYIYTISSASAYLVNFYLGLRLIMEKQKLEIVRIASRNIYFICCVFNWSWHLIWLFQHYYIMNIGHIVYFFLLFWIVKDDIILLSWLNNRMIKFN